LRSQKQLSQQDATGGASAPVLDQEVPEHAAAGDAGTTPPPEADTIAPEAAAPEAAAADVSDNGDSSETGGRADPDGPVVFDDLGGQSFSDAVDATIVEFDDGDIVTGKVVKIDNDEVLLDIGYKSEGVIPSRELSIRNDVDPNEVVTLDEELEALVLTKEDKDGRLILSKKRAQYERAWGTIEEIKEKEGIVEGPVIEVVKGGLIIDIGLRGFLPASLVDLRRVRDLHPFVGRKLECKIIELDKNRNNVVLSRRAFLEETQREQRDEFLANLKPGEVRTGVVSSVVNFGAFVDLGGMDGLVHVSELSWKHVDHPSSVVQVGDEVTVQVLDVDLDRERISLSLKATQQDPWQEFADGHQVGELVYGRVTKLVPFGAFVQVGDGIEGLVHISEMAVHHVEAPEQVVTPGEELWVKIIDIDLDRRRISLSIKQAAEGGVVAAEYQDQFGEHNYDADGNYIGPEIRAEPAAEAVSDTEGALAAAELTDEPVNPVLEADALAGLVTEPEPAAEAVAAEPVALEPVVPEPEPEPEPAVEAVVAEPEPAPEADAGDDLAPE
jgi:small subunit ribosomal protein S1